MLLLIRRRIISNLVFKVIVSTGDAAGNFPRSFPIFFGRKIRRFFQLVQPFGVANFEMLQQSLSSSKVPATFDAPQGFLLEMIEPRVLRELQLADEVLVAGLAFLRLQVSLRFRPRPVSFRQSPSFNRDARKAQDSLEALVQLCVAASFKRN